MMVHPDEREAIARGIDGAHFFGYALAHYYAFGDHRPGFTSIRDEFDRRRAEVGYDRDAVLPIGASLSMNVAGSGLGSSRGAIGTPAQVAELARRYERAGVDEMLLAVQTGGTRHEHICEALELFASEVMGEFETRRPAAEEDKRQRLAAPIAAALQRREPARAGDPSYIVNRSGEPFAAISQRAVGSDVSSLIAGVLERLQTQGMEALRALVARTGDDRIERIAGSDQALRAIFSVMERRYVPEAAPGLVGEIQYDLRRNGALVPWVVALEGDRARARPGESAEPRLRIGLSVADFVRVGTGELNAAKALIDGRIEVKGDLMVAARLGSMFGQASPF
jgi:putative sterol carrier protein